MLGRLNSWGAFAQLANWFDQLDSVNELAAAIALVTSCVIVVTHWALTGNESVG